MANRIKGITVEIGGDTTGLDKALKTVNTSIRSTQSALKDVNRLLKLDPSNTEFSKAKTLERCHRSHKGKAGFTQGSTGAGQATVGKWRTRSGQI